MIWCVNLKWNVAFSIFFLQSLLSSTQRCSLILMPRCNFLPIFFFLQSWLLVHKFFTITLTWVDHDLNTGVAQNVWRLWQQMAVKHHAWRRCPFSPGSVWEAETAAAVTHTSPNLPYYFHHIAFGSLAKSGGWRWELVGGAEIWRVIFFFSFFFLRVKSGWVKSAAREERRKERVRGRERNCQAAFSYLPAESMEMGHEVLRMYPMCTTQTHTHHSVFLWLPNISSNKAVVKYYYLK